jgi:hypothetical protein
MNRRSQSITLGLARLIAAVVIYTQSGCGAPSRHTVIVSELAALKTARSAFHEWDVARQERIGQSATSREEGEAQLAAHRKLRDQVTRAFAYAYDQLAEAARRDDDATLSRARRVATTILTFVQGLLPGFDPPVPEDLPCANASTEGC